MTQLLYHCEHSLSRRMSVILATQMCPRWMSTSVRSQQVRTRAMLDRMLRVDHAGEFGAVRIYAGQLAVLGQTSVGPVIKHMMNQEKVHLSTFEDLLPKHRVRPTALLPIWHMAGFMLGAGTALLGKEGAMACTVAVETAIGEHYDSQIRELLANTTEGKPQHEHLIKVIKKFRDEELEHLDTGLEHDAEKAPLYNILSQTIKVGCKSAIWLSERI